MKSLIVENEPVARLLLEKQICSFGFEVTICKDGITALAAVKETFYPLIVLDLGLPDIYGLDLCRQIRAIPGGDRGLILVLTERHDPGYLWEVIKAGADDYLTKPVSTELLKMRLTVVKRQLQNLVERKQAEEQSRFQAQLLNSVRESVIATDLEGHIVYWGQGAEDLYGYTAEEVMGKFITLIVGSRDEEAEQARMRHVRETGGWSGQYMKRRKDGSFFWADTVMSLVQDQGGQPCGIIGIDRDITEQKYAENALRASETQYRLLADKVADGIAIIQEGKVVFVNEALSSLCGYPSEQFIQKNLVELFHHDYQEHFKEWLEQITQLISVQPFQGLCVTGDGREIWTEWHPAMIEWEGKPAILLTTRDITESKPREMSMEEKEALPKGKRYPQIRCQGTLRIR